MPIVKRVVLVMIEGLTPDAVRFLSLYHLGRLRERGASGTIQSAASSLGGLRLSLMTGVSPQSHGLITNRPPYSGSLNRLNPMGACISAEGFQVSGFLPQLEPHLEGPARRLAVQLGFQHLSFKGTSASETVRTALNALCTQRRGLIAIHLDDIARRSEDGSWMSPAYAEAAQKIDQSAGLLSTLSGAEMGDTLLVVIADPSSGADGNALESQGDVSVTLSGRCIQSCSLAGISMMDVSATVLWALGVSVPRNYEGRVLSEAFKSETREAAPTRKQAFA